MFSVPVFRFSFTSSWKMLGLAVLCMACMVRLGFWQLHRAEEKRQLLASFQAQIQRPPVMFPGTTVQQYQRVNIQVQAVLPITLLLDNQHHAHQFGYDVVTPLVLTDGSVILLDRGWIAGDPSRVTLPTIPNFATARPIIGQVYYPDSRQWLLGSGIEVKHRNLAVIETLNLDLISQFLHKSLYPFIIRQSAEQQSDTIRDWPIIATNPERHIAYAVQWFLFAAIAGVMYIILHVKRKK